MQRPGIFLGPWDWVIMRLMLEHASETVTELIGPDDPPPVEVVGEDASAPVVICCDHAGAAIPAAMGTLGLDTSDLDRHIAFDIGAAWVARRLAAALTATAVLASYSRLLIDCNRPLDDHTSIREISDRTVVPGNRGLDGAVQRARAETFFWPYHAVLGRVIGRWRAQGIAPIVIAVHSYTPAMNGTERPWQLGILSNRDRRIANPLLAALAALPDLVIGDNQPYSGLEPYGYTVETHAIPAGLANVLLEFRQDEIEDEAGAHLWADRVAAALGPILEDRSLCRPFEG